MKKGDFVKWTALAEDGKPCSYIGKVQLAGDVIIFETPFGTMHVPKTDGKFEEVDEPDDWMKQMLDRQAARDAHAAELEAEQSETRRRVSKRPSGKAKQLQPKQGSKLAQALDLYKHSKDKSRKHIIELFVKELKMTPAGASTYQATCKKVVGD